MIKTFNFEQITNQTSNIISKNKRGKQFIQIKIKDHKNTIPFVSPQ